MSRSRKSARQKQSIEDLVDGLVRSTAPKPDAARAILRKHDCTLDDLARRLQCTVGAALDCIESLRKSGVPIALYGGRYSVPKITPQVPYSDDLHRLRSDVSGHYKFGIISDTHLGSKHERLDVCEDLYDWFAKEGVTHVLHGGNWIDGEKHFNRHELQDAAHGRQNQLTYMVEKYPHRRGITTLYVTGDDHEGWYNQSDGGDIGGDLERLARESGRDDLRNCGYVEAFFTLENKRTGETSKLLLQHPGGGSAYALSYAPQKVIESFQPGEKPGVVVFGHWHKMEFANVRGVWSLQAGCFPAQTRIRTSSGLVPIEQIKVGDEVLTHKKRWRRVTDTMKRWHDGRFLRFKVGPTGFGVRRGAVTCTDEHPFLTPDGFVEAKSLKAGDYIAVEANERDGKLIPWDRKFTDEERFKQTPNKRRATPDSFRHNVEMREIAARRVKDGSRVLLLGDVVPDAIEIDWENRRVVALELERNRSCPSNPRKYDAVPGMYDSVDWICTGRRGTYRRYDYIEKYGHVFVPIRSVEESTHARWVYNFSVEEDESYQAAGCFVHNCTKDLDTFGRKKRLSYHVGGAILELEQSERGEIRQATPRIRYYYDRDYYNGQFSLSGPVRKVRAPHGRAEMARRAKNGS